MNRSSYLDEIDGLRAIAVVAVLIFHFDSTFLVFGYLGVDIFFAISGYVITKSILERMHAGNFTLNDFFMRRMKRLLPALFVVVIASIIVGALLLKGRTTIATGAAALGGMSNIALWFAGHDYFALAAELNPLTHTWSLGVEEQFYLLFPFLLLITRKRLWATFFVLGLTASVSLVSYLGLWSEHRLSVFYLAPFRFWELMGGALVYLVHSRWGCAVDALKQNYMKHGLLAFLVFVLCSGYLPEHLATLLCVLGSFGILYFSSRSSRPNILLVNRLSVMTGRISYSLYLWHWPVAVFGRLLLPEVALLPAYILLTIGLSVLSYRYIERPFRHGNWTWFRERFLFAFPSYAAIAMLIVAGLWLAKPAMFLGPAQMFEKQFLASNACHIPGENGLNECLQASTRDRNTIWLIGDSHAGNFTVSLRDAGAMMNLDFQFLTGRSLFLSLANRCSDSICPEGAYVDLADRLKAVHKPGDIVMISFAHDRFLGSNLQHAEFGMNFRKFIGSLRQAALNIVLIEDIPKVCEDDGEYQRSVFRGDVCNKSAAQSLDERLPLSAIYHQAKEYFPLTIVDPHNLLCNKSAGRESICSNWLDGELLYLDASPHLTRQASSSLAGFFATEITPIVGAGQ